MNLKKLDNEDKLLLGAGLLSLGVVGWFWYKSKKENEPSTPLLDTPVSTAPDTNLPKLATPPLAPKLKALTLNKALVLKRGSKGAEVKALQRQLGSVPDGVFGRNTENKLLQIKGVKQISLNALEGKISVPAKVLPSIKADVPYKKGQRLMVNVRTGFTAQSVKQKADGTYFTDGKNVTTLLGFGDEIGTIQSVLIRNDGLVRYVVKGTVLGFPRLLWVAHQNVTPIKN
jgi:hypothetical protein